VTQILFSVSIGCVVQVQIRARAKPEDLHLNAHSKLQCLQYKLAFILKFHLFNTFVGNV